MLSIIFLISIYLLPFGSLLILVLGILVYGINIYSTKKDEITQIAIIFAIFINLILISCFIIMLFKVNESTGYFSELSKYRLSIMHRPYNLPRLSFHYTLIYTVLCICCLFLTFISVCVFLAQKYKYNYDYQVLLFCCITLLVEFCVIAIIYQNRIVLKHFFLLLL